MTGTILESAGKDSELVLVHGTSSQRHREQSLSDGNIRNG